MQKLLSLAAVLLAASAVTAQAPSCNGPAPAGTLTTRWVGGVYLGTTSATVGRNEIFDLSTNADLTISQVDLNFYDNGAPAPNPVLTGLTTAVEFWTCPTTAVGNYTNQAAWTLAGTGTVTIAAPGTPSPAVFTPFPLLAGSYGVAIHVAPVFEPVSATNVASHPLYTNPTSNPIPTVYSDQYLTLTARGNQGTAWTGTPALRVWNGNIHYQPGANAGYTTAFGAGCYNLPQSFYEAFPAGTGTQTSYDLANTTVSLLNQGNRYLVASMGPAAPIVQPTSTALVTTGATYDDDLTAAITLPWSFPYPGGTTSSIIVSTNGHIYLGTSTATYGPYTLSQLFTDNSPRLAAAWCDYDMTASGHMYYDVDPNNNFATVTFWQVPEWDPTAATTGLGANTFQIVLYPSGNVDFVYNTVDHFYSPFVVGFGRGGNTADPGNTDISTAMPFLSGDGRVPATLVMNARPVTGQTLNFVCTGFDVPSTTFGVFALSFGGDPGTPLAVYGMPGCQLYVALPAVTAFSVASGGALSTPLTIPNDPSFNGVNLFCQAAPLSANVPVYNTAGIVTSNGLCVHMGIQ